MPDAEAHRRLADLLDLHQDMGVDVRNVQTAVHDGHVSADLTVVLDGDEEIPDEVATPVDQAVDDSDERVSVPIDVGPDDTPDGDAEAIVDELEDEDQPDGDEDGGGPDVADDEDQAEDTRARDDVWCGHCGDGPFKGEAGLKIHHGNRHRDGHSVDPVYHDPDADPEDLRDDSDDNDDNEPEEPPRYDCPDCDRTYVDQASLDEHRVEHVDVEGAELPGSVTEAGLAAVAEQKDDVRAVAVDLEVDEDRALALLAKHGVLGLLYDDVGDPGEVAA